MGQGTDDRILADVVVSTEVMLLYSARKNVEKSQPSLQFPEASMVPLRISVPSDKG